MNNSIVNVLSNMPNVLKLKGSPADDIAAAEETLNLIFSDEYKAYCKAFGAASVSGRQITGAVPYPDMNVVTLTESARTIFPDIPASWYVVCDAHIDDLIYWQDGEGNVYQTVPGEKPRRVARSLVEFLS